MLGKLVKDEMKSYRLGLGIVLLAGFIFTVFFKVLCMLPYQTAMKDSVQMMLIVSFVLVLFLMGAATQVLIIVRFYSTMVGDRGYLTWTLPATSQQHIGAKLIGGILWKLIITVAMAALAVLFFVGNYWIWLQDFSEGYLSLGVILQEAVREMLDGIETEDIVVFVLEIVSYFVWFIVSMLAIYMCIAVGQLFGKWRLLASIGCYFLLMILVQIVSTLWLALVAVRETVDADFYYDTAVQSVPGAILSIVGGLVAGVVVFLITNYIFKKHLNLE
jgi:hypothetical protein